MNGLLVDAEYIFEFEGMKFRLVRGTDTELDKLCTITDASETANETAYETALRLCDYLSWEWNIGIRCMNVGGVGFKEGQFTLENLPIAFFHARSLRSTLVEPRYLPNVQSDEAQVALSLLNEARYSNSPFFSSINYWKILEIPPPGTSPKGKPENRAIRWIDQVSSSRVYFLGEFRDSLKKQSVNLTAGNYLWKECRNAIAHITRPPVLTPSKTKDRQKILQAKRALSGLAEFYVRTSLGLDKRESLMRILKVKKKTTALKLLRKGNKLKPRLRNFRQS